MPRRTDIHSILIIGSGPIVIGQGCEFDYSGVQACRALREEGYRIVLINSNPATIMTDPEFADATYIEPITPEAVEKILEREKQNGTPVDALLPTLGGQTGLNTGMACWDRGILQKYNVKMIGANRDAIHRGEDRQVFKDLMIQIGLKVPRSGVVHNIEDARKVLDEIGLPLIIRPAFTLGGTGGGIAYNLEEFESIVQGGLDASPVTEVLVEQSVIGWKEYEMEVMRDKNDNVVIICSIENIDAMGVHTGDSITVAPIQTLTDKEYQRMRDASIAVIRAVGVETGGSNIQFGINPDNGEMVVIEMNPRVSRSSALASKATGYPIAKLAAKLAVGYTLDELPNYITSRKKPIGGVSSPRDSAADPVGGGSNPSGSVTHPTGSVTHPTGSVTHPTGSVTHPTGSVTHPTGSVTHPTGLVTHPTGSVTPPTGLVTHPTGLVTPPTGLVTHPTGSTSKTAGSAPSGIVREEYELYTSACFEPTIDYCVIKIPRWTFEKFPDADETLTTQMKSVGEAMAIGRTFKEALQKGIRSMEVKRFGFGLDKYDKWLNAQHATRDTGLQPVPGSADNSATSGSSASNDAARHGLKTRVTGEQPDASDKTTQGESVDHEWPIPADKLRRKLAVPSQGRLYYLRYALKMGWTIDEIYELTKIDRWFLGQMRELVEFEEVLVRARDEDRPSMDYFALMLHAKQWGYSDMQLAAVMGMSVGEVRTFRRSIGVEPVYKLVDTCAAEFEASTPYYYSTYETPFVSPGVPGNRTVVTEAVDALRLAHMAIGESPDSSAEFTEGLPKKWTEASAAEDEIRLTDRPKVIIIGGGPNRIGQGIEFDYCCVQAAFAMRELGIESVMINSNPETVSTDYDTSDLLFFEPLTHEDILNICERLNGGSFVVATPASPRAVDLKGQNTSRELQEATQASQLQGNNLVKGVIVQFGGQTPLNLAKGLKEAGVPIIGTSVKNIDAAGDREQFRELLKKLGLKQPENGIARNVAEARAIAKRVGYPVLVRPSFVLGGRAMEIVSDEAQLNYYMANAIDANAIADAPILVDKFLDAATEVDVDCLADFDPTSLSPVRGGEGRGEGQGARLDAKQRDDAQPSPSPYPSPRGTGEREQEAGQAFIIGVMEHIEEAGIHSGDSACSLPPYSLSKEIIEKLKDQTRALAKALRVNGLMNVQYAIKDGEIYVIEVNPRASRTVPFVSKAQGQPFAKIAAKVMAGKTLKELGIIEPTPPKHVSVKEVVFPFAKFPGVDVILGPEMRSTGEVMGIDHDFPMAFAKAQLAAGTVLPTSGTIYISVRDGDKEAIVPVAKSLAEAGFEIIATGGTLAVLQKNDIPASKINKLAEGRPNIKDYIKNGKVKLIINTPTKKGPQTDEGKIRSLAVLNKVPIVTTITGASAAARAIQAMRKEQWGVKPLQAYFAKSGNGGER